MREVGLCGGVRTVWFFALLLALLAPVTTAVAEDGDYFHKGLGHQNPLPEWAEDEDVYFLALPGEGPAAEIAAAEAMASPTLEVPEDAPLTHLGGPVQHEPHIHLILWGSQWQESGEPEAMRGALNLLYSGLDGSRFQGILTQYFDNSEKDGAFPSHITNQVTFNPSASEYPTRDTYVDDDVFAPTGVGYFTIKDEIRKVLKETNWPTGLDHHFVVVPAPNATYTSEFSEFCGLHEFIAEGTWSFLRPGAECGGVSGLSRTASHEYAETVADPQPFSGWLVPVVDANGNLVDRVEMANFSCPEVEDEERVLENGAPITTLRDNYQLFTEGRKCSVDDPNPPQLSIKNSTVTLGQPGQMNVEADVEPAGYPKLKYFVEWKVGVGFWTKASGGGTLEGVGNGGPVHVSVPVSGNAVANGVAYRLTVQIPTDGYQEEVTGRAFGKAIPLQPEWRVALCTTSTEPCAVADRYPTGTSISGVPSSSPYYPRFQLNLEPGTPFVTCTGGGAGFETTGTAGLAVAASQNQWSFSNCTATKAGISEGSCTVKTSNLPTAGSIGWKSPGTGRVEFGTAGDPDPDVQITCPQMSPPVNCSYSFEPLKGTVEGGSPSKLYVHAEFTTNAAADAAESGEACPGRMSSFNAHYLLESPKPLYVTGFGKLQPLVSTGEASPVGVGSQVATRLSGTVDPNGLASGYRFQYVTDGNYKAGTADPFSAASSAPVEFSSVGSGKGAVAVSQDLTGLQADTLYHYRLTAENVEGPRLGEERTFRTPPACAGGGSCAYSLQAPVNPQAQQQSELADVSCPTTTVCIGLGNDYYRGRGFLESWKNGSWSLVYTYTGTMEALACPTATWCMSVAKNDDDAWRVKSFEFFGEYWDVETLAPPLPQGGSELRINDVSCTSESACTMVGRYSSGGQYKPYVARWNGTSWSQQTAPSPTEGNAGEALLAVSCASSTSCLAVGKAAGKPFAERWNGTEWSLSSVPNPSGSVDASLQGISCTASNACVAVGSYAKSGASQKTLAASFNGTAWTVLSTPNPAKEGAAILREVSCLSSTSCIAVGSLSTPAPLVAEEEATLALSWNGTSWTLQSSPNAGGSLFSAFNAISCTTATTCTTVGATRPGGKLTSATLAARWG